jgi:hypothetical protein
MLFEKLLPGAWELCRVVHHTGAWMRCSALCLVCTVALVACGGSEGQDANDGGADDRAMGDTTGGSPDLGSDMATNPDASSGGCWPPCIANLRALCPRPGGTSCMAEMGAGYNNYCFSTGVKENITTTDGGLLSYSYTQTDGHTLCFYMLLDPASNPPAFRYYNSQMMLVGTVEVVMPNAAMSDYLVDCQGVQTTVTVEQQQRPECLMASERDCVAGRCP